MNNERPILVIQLPERLVVGRVHVFFREVHALLKGNRPRLVFDFSSVRQLDSAGVEMLLSCAEEVLKRNGDLKLAAIPEGPAEILRLTKVDSLFEIFEDPSEAVESFRWLASCPLPTAPSWDGFPSRERESAA